ncbi:DNA-binding response regulator [Candidatus Roizmanbacteria bacterium RIFCSPHIGHO2_01_FULL_39_8]|uniref:DNA-binding response regulator n=3 Tax=Candidatus Roizmaniibacteriota TaxID=1752723 RepID=A0A1F7GRY5_9BACT|nr:MAG: DNA-binding response regulator [Candidatus Roizmanbacteria bacterium RIFCSPHIGHO2_01_FULL_39_8]OGK26020.1 MAG: DNA-binding response regulator [Candidatus Roizmanbacteria bacterium RIFCSPHIGHO2_02_FULL_39_9]OGK34823.1 MAG: DNA-binding response regulator [Candidatus Roizmanbacteria bacterium RIFCSPHIGHO2_12_FULL_39_8]
MRILIIEDEHRLSNVVKKGLVEEGFAVDQAFDGEEGLYLAESEAYDLLILDLMLPKIDGLKVCRELRNKKIKTPILILTAKTKIEDKVKGLESGADDYLAKPFAYAELKARIQALLRRSHNEGDPILKLDDLELDPAKHIVMRSKKTISLTPKEFAILEYLLRYKNDVVTRTQVTEHVWDYNFDALSNVVDVFIATLRRKINKGFPKKLIRTVHGVGYKMK